MAEIVLALAASARDWSDRLHGFLVDHGGARVRTVIMGPGAVAGEDYDVLVIDDICSFLTPHLVDTARRAGRLVVGVFEAGDGADAKRRLLDCGVDDVIESAAPPDEFLRTIEGVCRWRSTDEIRRPPPAPTSPPGGRVVVVGGPPGGCGSTELTVALAAEWGAVAVDADDVAPSLAQRLDAPLHPNLRTAIDTIQHRSGLLEEAAQTCWGLSIVGGLASGDDWFHLDPSEVITVVDELAAIHDCVVVNVSPGLERPEGAAGRFGLARALVARADRVVGVGLPTPVGVTRLVRWLSEAHFLAPEARFHVVVNRVGRSSFRRSEVEREIGRHFPAVPVTFAPWDPRVEEASWSGRLVERGPFVRAVGRVAGTTRPRRRSW
jgi:MinD-like ATPase involved in chromosome partitioning or flagellar assembly